jgi:hypothetical protein
MRVIPSLTMWGSPLRSLNLFPLHPQHKWPAYFPLRMSKSDSVWPY